MKPLPSRLLDMLRLAATVLDERGHSWALVGGLAVSMRVEPRFTRDVDIAVAVADDAAAEALVATFLARGFTTLVVLEQQALGRLATVRVVPPGESETGVVVDLLFASSGIEPEVCAAAERVELQPGFDVPVARAGHLVAMKLLASSPDRPQDEMDLQHLLRQIVAGEQDRAIDAVERIEARGANRGKPLGAELRRRLAR